MMQFDYDWKGVSLDTFVGKTFVAIEKVDVDGNEGLRFIDTDGNVFVMVHRQDCCETVWIEDITGDIADIVGYEILRVFENYQTGESRRGTFTYSFYTLTTFQGSVTIRFNGESNGYYSESVSIFRVDDGGEK